MLLRIRQLVTFQLWCHVQCLGMGSQLLFSCYLVDCVEMQHSRQPLLVTVAGPCHVPFVRHATWSQRKHNFEFSCISRSSFFVFLIPNCISCQVSFVGCCDVMLRTRLLFSLLARREATIVP